MSEPLIPERYRMTAIIPVTVWDAATIRPDQEPALSEGFCPQCLSRLQDPIAGFDGAGSTLVAATQCSNPRCLSVYLLDR